MKHKKEDYQFFNLAVEIPWLHAILSSLVSLLWNPKLATQSLLDLQWSPRRVVIVLLVVLIGVMLVDIALLTINPSWKYIVFSLEHLWRDSWGVGVLNILQGVFVLFLKYLVYVGLIFLFFKFLKRPVAFVNLIWWAILSIVVWYIHFKVFDFLLLLGRESAPLAKPYANFVYLGGVFYCFCLQVITLAATTKSKISVAGSILVGFQLFLLAVGFLLIFLSSLSEPSYDYYGF